MSSGEPGTITSTDAAVPESAAQAGGPDRHDQAGVTAALPLASGRESLAVLWPLLRERRGYLLLVAVAGLVGAVAGLVAPWVIGRLVDVLPGSDDYSAVWAAAGAIAVAGVVGAGCTWAGQAWLARLTEPTVARLREMVMDRSLRLGAAQMETTETGDLVSRVAEDAREISQAATAVIPPVVQSLFTVVVSGVGLATVDWRLGLVGLVALPMYWTTLRWYLPRSGPIYAAERAAFGTRASRLLGGITGSRTLHAYDAQDAELRRITAASAQARDLSIRVFYFVTRAFSRNNRAEVTVLGLLLVVGFFLVDADIITAGAVTTAALLFRRLFNPIGALVGMVDQVQSAGASLVRMVGVITMPVPERTAAPEPGPLELAGVSHSYGESSPGGAAPALIDVDLTLAPGEVVAVVGSTGAGKSTLALVAAGTLTPSGGSVRMGGVSLTEVDPVALRQRITMVSQEVHSFAATIAENVRAPRREAPEAEVRAALRTVGADWVDDLPDGIHTVIGEGGHPLDPMQSQMLALARVELADPDVVILDEATAEAGSAGARRLDDAAAAVLRERAGLVVAHRLSQAVSADRILVMEHGRVVESGTHDELLRADGRYAKLARAWFGV
ncbi:ABC transporter ATP-binding protein [Dietzia cinnamea]|uniref:ATP-binding cassette subfamily C protein n=1 Tax=Dietzia cinnamea TaxID=321318 RepID=A0A4V6P4I7_9ACTN|nr:ABC transporter ATP-binding protein [Dietzia cinnamea]TCW22792.1 ATP-binding cassette subfamily C protein [Dietzia cinnamea]